MFDRNEAYEKILVADLQRVIDFLKFAEAKNAALLALSSAWILATIGMECSGRSFPKPFGVAISIALLLVLAAAAVSATSFYPKLGLPAFLGGKKAGPHPENLLFFGDIASMTTKTFQQEVRARYFPDKDEQRDEYLHDLTVQINVNSMITLRKMKLFRWALGLVLAAGGCLLLPALIMAYAAFKGGA